MNRVRQHLEARIEELIDLLDEVDSDADLEPDELEEQHDAEADPAENGLADSASLAAVIAAMSLRNSLKRH